MLNNVYIALVVLLLFGAAIFLHELGHYWVALKRGMKVEEFAIGFGPKLFSWKARNGVLWSVRAIPAGGFVKLPQMVTSEALEGKTEDELPPASPFSKILVAVAGPVMNVLFAFAIATVLYFTGIPTPKNPPLVGFMEPGSVEAKLGIKQGDRIVSVDGKPVKTWTDVVMHSILALTNVLPVAIERDGVTNLYQLETEPSPIAGKLLRLNPVMHPKLGRIIADGPADKAGLKKDDEVVQFAGVPVATWEQMVGLVRKSAGQECLVKFRRDGSLQETKVTPLGKDGGGIGQIQVEASRTVEMVDERPGPLPWVQMANVWDQMVNTINALVHSKQTGIKAKDLSGPVGIIGGLASQVSMDFRLGLSFLVLLNINLAVLNMLPIPVLDGGHITMSIYELIRGKPVSPKFVEWATSACALLLISFMLYVTFFDINRMPLLRSLMKTEVKMEQPTNPAPAEAMPAPAK
jgi:regulator of sigma E protease